MASALQNYHSLNILSHARQLSWDPKDKLKVSQIFHQEFETNVLNDSFWKFRTIIEIATLIKRPIDDVPSGNFYKRVENVSIGEDHFNICDTIEIDSKKSLIIKFNKHKSIIRICVPLFTEPDSPNNSYNAFKVSVFAENKKTKIQNQANYIFEKQDIHLARIKFTTQKIPQLSKAPSQELLNTFGYFELKKPYKCKSLEQFSSKGGPTIVKYTLKESND